MKQFRKFLGAVGVSTFLLGAGAASATEYTGSLDFAAATPTPVTYQFNGSPVNGMAGVAIQRFDLGSNLNGAGMSISLTLGNLNPDYSLMGVFFASQANDAIVSNPSSMAGLLTTSDVNSFMNATVADWNYIAWGNVVQYNGTTDVAALFEQPMNGFSPGTNYYAFVFGGSAYTSATTIADSSAAFTLSVASVPEPGIWMTMMAGLGVLGVMRRRASILS